VFLFSGCMLLCARLVLGVYAYACTFVCCVVVFVVLLACCVILYMLYVVCFTGVMRYVSYNVVRDMLFCLCVCVCVCVCVCAFVVVVVVCVLLLLLLFSALCGPYLPVSICVV